ncbi:MAG: hypothetical protein Ct9H300mP14_04690 [Gammaproteobacteria bacterium]|nr:MAG: hypothetical protein Ct9H300mP14_04690 [Gammaproteobacteria bacterium]
MRRILFEQTGGMFSDLVTRSDLKIFLPPIGGATLYFFGNPEYLTDNSRRLTCRVHDECNGSDFFGSDICTCRPYLVHGIEECVREAQNKVWAWLSITARKDVPWVRSRNSWSTTHVNDRTG